MGYYWKQGLITGLVVGLLMHVLMQQLQARPPLAQGNFPVDNPQAPAPLSRPHTPLGPLMGLTIFALCWVMPGPNAAKVGQ
ncbi:MAG: hypothetical protein U0931_26095 [Vulcanimicrobiota bacterium]